MDDWTFDVDRWLCLYVLLAARNISQPGKFWVMPNATLHYEYGTWFRVQNVHRRLVYYISGYDPIRQRRYRELYRKQTTR